MRQELRSSTVRSSAARTAPRDIFPIEVSVPGMKQDINGLRDAVRPFLARYLPIGDRRRWSSLLFYMFQVLLAVPEKR